MNRFQFAVMFSLAMNILAGCAGLRAAAMERQFILDSVSEFSFQERSDTMRGYAKQLLIEEGYLPQVDPNDPSIVYTNWKYLNPSTPPGTDAPTSSYMVQLVEGRQGTRVFFNRLTQTSTAQSTQQRLRDLDLEFELVKRFDPAAAHRIEAQAQAEARKTR